MKTINTRQLIALALGASLIVSCKQDVITLKQPTTTITEVTGSKGNADFSKFVSIGNSLTAGYQAGALFTSGQANSFPLILSKQFAIAQKATITFNQPDINSVNGFNSSYSNISSGIIRGRLVLFAADGIQAHAVPTPAGAPGVPAPYNTADVPTPYTGDKSKLNNFGVPGILLGQVLDPRTGGPSGTVYYNGLYARFATNPGTSTILGDAVATQPTFFTFDLGNNDVLGYATTGGDGSIPLTPKANFQGYYSAAISTLMGSSSSVKGVVSTIPNVTTIPFFYTVKWNNITIDAATATTLMGATAFGGYNSVLTGLAGALTATPAAFGLTANQAAPIIAEIATRHVNYVAGSNPILIKDETLVDLGAFFDGMVGAGAITPTQRAGLTPYQQIRQTTSSDLIPLTAGGVLGKPGTFGILGVSEPLGDKYVLIPTETAAIQTATADFNSIITTVAAGFPDRIAVADVNAAFTSFVTNQVIIADGVAITPNFTPPTGAFSEDGVHPNSRGYAYMANIFIDAINAKFGATVPHASLADYSGVGLPLVP